MSQSHFVRKHIISACTDSLDDIYSFRIRKLKEAEAELAAFEKKATDRTLWQRFWNYGGDYGDAMARGFVAERIRTNGDWFKDHEKRLKVMLTFCIVIEDPTVSITAQEFKDFSKFYKG